MAGSVTLNGVDDEILAIAFKFKAEHEGLFSQPSTNADNPDSIKSWKAKARV